MKAIRMPIISTAIVFTLVLSGCASQSQLASLEKDVSALRLMTETASGDATRALQDTERLRNDIAAVKQASKSASNDAAATRRLLEQMNARLEKGAGTSSFK